MTGLSPAAPWMAAGLLAFSVLLVLHRPLGKLLRLLVRSSLALAVLAGLQQVGGALGISLGVNWLNALVMGALGAPGFGLLLMLQWALRTGG